MLIGMRDEQADRMKIGTCNLTFLQVIGFTGYPLPPESDSIGRSYFRSNRWPHSRYNDVEDKNSILQDIPFKLLSFSIQLRGQVPS